MPSGRRPAGLAPAVPAPTVRGPADGRSAAKPPPSPKQRAVADADAILASFAVPPGALKLSRAPNASGGVLDYPMQTPGTPDLVDKAGWWLAPGTPRQVLAWEAAHLSHRFSRTATGSSSGPAGTVPVVVNIFSLPAIPGVLDSRELLVQVVADGKKTAIRVDAQVTWIPARPASEKVPSAAKAVTISQDLGLNQGNAKPPKPVTITDQALAVATVELSGCPGVDFTIGGKPQPALGAASGARILKIAGLPWKIPGL